MRAYESASPFLSSLVSYMFTTIKQANIVFTIDNLEPFEFLVLIYL